VCIDLLPKGLIVTVSSSSIVYPEQVMPQLLHYLKVDQQTQWATKSDIAAPAASSGTGSGERTDSVSADAAAAAAAGTPAPAVAQAEAETEAPPLSSTCAENPFLNASQHVRCSFFFFYSILYAP
jgi:hypothetical protein